MALPIQRDPTPRALADDVVANPVSGEGWGGHVINSLGELLGYNTIQPVISCNLPRLTAGTAGTGTFKIPYKRSYGAQVVLFTASPHKGNAAGAELTVAASATGLMLIAPSGSGANPYDGSSRWIAPSDDRMAFPQVSGFADVTSMTVGSIADITVATADVSASGGRGLATISIYEMPLGVADPVASSSEVGLQPGWVQSNGSDPTLHDGSTTTSTGFQRALYQMETARSGFYRHVSVITSEDDNYAWQASSTSYSNLWPNNPGIVVRPRLLYVVGGVNQANTYTYRIRHKDSGANQLKVRIQVTPEGGATTNNDFTLTNRAAYTADTGTITLPTTGTGQRVRINLLGATNTMATTCYVSSFSLHENES